jgi:hypothetical protein
VRHGIVFLKKDVIKFCPLPHYVFLLDFFGFQYSAEFTVAPFSTKSVSTTPSQFQNTDNMTFPAQALDLNFFGAGKPL